jgi:hypothetical protein
MWGCMAVKSGINYCSVINDGPSSAVLNSALKNILCSLYGTLRDFALNFLIGFVFFFFQALNFL